MEQHLGDEFEGVITAVKHFGLFVMLSDLFVEGLVHVTSLSNDYYHAEHGGLRLTGEQTGNSYGLGDHVRVKITRVDVEEARIDLQMVEEASASKHSGKRAGKKKTAHKNAGKKKSDNNSGKKKSGKKTGSNRTGKRPAKKRRR